jgi:hypothetical protein
MMDDEKMPDAMPADESVPATPAGGESSEESEDM